MQVAPGPLASAGKQLNHMPHARLAPSTARLAADSSAVVTAIFSRAAEPYLDRYFEAGESPVGSAIAEQLTIARTECDLGAQQWCAWPAQAAPSGRDFDV